MKKWWKTLSLTLSFVLASVSFAACDLEGFFDELFGEDEQTEIQEPQTPAPEIGGVGGDFDAETVMQIQDRDLSIHFLELGNEYTGDCTLIKTGDTEV